MRIIIRDTYTLLYNLQYLIIAHTRNQFFCLINRLYRTCAIISRNFVVIYLRRCSAARNAVGSPWRASTWWRRPASEVVAPAEAVPATPRVAAMRAAAAAAVAGYRPGYHSRWDTGRPVRSTRSTFSPLASRIAPNGYVPYGLVRFFLSLVCFFLPPLFFPSFSSRDRLFTSREIRAGFRANIVCSHSTRALPSFDDEDSYIILCDSDILY